MSDDNRNCLNRFYDFLDKIGDIVIVIIDKLTIPFTILISRTINKEK